ncbi:hypothetical protein AMJ47_04130 [Parcubacteria bacterium DG_72]|nr:MAG: hypothetical protein AMJ47_04130 [Parcubacteria bacterium DG_72]
MKKINTTLLIVSSIIAFVIFLTSVAGIIYYTQFKGEKARREVSVDLPGNNKETERKIKELEDRLKDIEQEHGLTKDQISAVVELWCPDDNYDINGFLSMGSGTIVSDQGIIFTNRHVISNEDWSIIESSPTCYVGITEDISQPSTFMYMADLLAYSPQTDDFFDFDIAVLYIYDVCYDCPNAPGFLPDKFPFLELGYSSNMAPGDYVAIVGYPEIGAGTWNFTDGIISGRVGSFVLKTDAKIDSGNSGGAALNAKNQLIGIPTWTITGQAESIGYIIEIDDVYDWFEKEVLPLVEEE